MRFYVRAFKYGETKGLFIEQMLKIGLKKIVPNHMRPKNIIIKYFGR